MSSTIVIRNARTHNLKGLDIDIPRDKLVVFTGVSGSGKSSLVFHTIYTESQRQLVETISTFAQRRLPMLSRPPVDEISNISTPIVIDQKRMGKTSRSTVGTATEVNTYLRMLFSRYGEPLIGPSFYFSFNNPAGMCPACNGLGQQIRVDPDLLIDPSLSIKDGALTHPECKVGGYYWREIVRSGLFDVDKPVAEFPDAERDLLLYSPSIEVKGTLEGKPYTGRFEGVHTKLNRIFASKEEDEVDDSKKNVYQRYLVHSECDTCHGARLNPRALSVTVDGRSIDDACNLELVDLREWLNSIRNDANEPLARKMTEILGHLIEGGVGYLTLNRAVSTLSGGESQRVKMARQLDCDLVGLLYILDEPSIGLHPRDTQRLIGLLKRLRDKGNTVLTVEHDPDVIRSADYVIDIGPGPGERGGNLVFSGTPDELVRSGSITGRYLQADRPFGDRRHTPPGAFGQGRSGPGDRRGHGTKPRDEPDPRRPAGWFEITNANAHNLQDLSVRIPKGVFCCFTGVSGSGKSSLLHDTFVPLHPHAVVVDQSPVGRSSRSTPLSYLGVFDRVRTYFAKQTGAHPSLFSFNSAGACPKCRGAGTLSIEMNFMDDITLECDECEGRRFTAEALGYTVDGVSIHDVLRMTARQAIDYFSEGKITRPLEMMASVGLDYLELGQPLNTLSGGECQRLKLAGELHKSGSIYVLDEPTTGLHGADVDTLLTVLHTLADNGNSVLVIEHNPDVISQSDWVIDLGPGGGRDGGRLVAEGPPERIAACEASLTGRFLKTSRTDARTESA